eukprot:scaffold157158_cov22-Tisochrysis_lutea.AAC.6
MCTHKYTHTHATHTQAAAEQARQSIAFASEALYPSSRRAGPSAGRATAVVSGQQGKPLPPQPCYLLLPPGILEEEDEACSNSSVMGDVQGSTYAAHGGSEALGWEVSTEAGLGQRLEQGQGQKLEKGQGLQAWTESGQLGQRLGLGQGQGQAQRVEQGQGQQARTEAGMGKWVHATQQSYQAPQALPVNAWGNGLGTLQGTAKQNGQQHAHGVSGSLHTALQQQAMLDDELLLSDQPRVLAPSQLINCLGSLSSIKQSAGAADRYKMKV